eukprot:CAMPEP_0172439600 /NCGR_PEP_ID=MMETSP1065-20121228/534_1 /TAXON_ID=265537 /ORGANISM="Amphiprora paludosa, Strain CCMP125" /LENGTH=556 /DNA_ID=CAMNT_0013188303 /DNA_START=30 /DNA_END=1697 /DNA_ORIENTATION=-
MTAMNRMVRSVTASSVRAVTPQGTAVPASPIWLMGTRQGDPWRTKSTATTTSGITLVMIRGLTTTTGGGGGGSPPMGGVHKSTVQSPSRVGMHATIVPSENRSNTAGSNNPTIPSLSSPLPLSAKKRDDNSNNKNNNPYKKSRGGSMNYSPPTQTNKYSFHPIHDRRVLPPRRPSKSLQDIRKLVGTYKPTTVTQTEIRDCHGQLILQPPQMSSKKLISSSPKRSDNKVWKKSESIKSDDGKNNRSATISTTSPHEEKIFSSLNSLPLLNASVLLDTKQYIKNSANASTSRSGTEAARRLLRGRREWLQTVRKHAERGLDHSLGLSPSSSLVAAAQASSDQHVDQRRAAYRLTGHGVPRQLLQDHVDFAGELLAEHNATSLTIPSKEWMRIKTPDGSHQTLPLPENDHSLHLYQAVMERIARTLSIVLHRGPILGNSSLSSSDVTMDEYDNPWSRTINRNSAAAYMESHLNSSASSFSGAANSGLLQHQQQPVWHIEFTRGWVVAEPIMKHQLELEPVVEWIWPRQICIRLRGRPSNSNMAVALAYDATTPQLNDW